MPEPVYSRIAVDHDEALDYHEWITLGERVKADRLGRLSPRMWGPTWTRWLCNNGDCPAWGLVSDDLVRRSLEAHDRLVRVGD